MKVYAAINQVMAELAKIGIAKDRTNTTQGYKFRGIDDVYNVLARLLSDAKLCILPRVIRREVTERATQKGGILFYVVCDVEFDLVHAEDDSKHTIAVIGEAMDSADKATNKAMSAAYKYACFMAFCIPTEGDNDAESGSSDAVESNYADWHAAITACATKDELTARKVEMQKAFPGMIPKELVSAYNIALKAVKS